MGDSHLAGWLAGHCFIPRKLETNLKKTVDEIAQVETMIRNLKDAIWDKDAPNKVAQTRLTNRHQRPNIELCRDEPAHRLVEEVVEIEDTVRNLEKKVEIVFMSRIGKKLLSILLQLEECENRQRELQSIRLALEKEISVKKTSISIDRDRCLR